MVDSSYNNDYYEEEGGKNSIIKKIKISLGAICLTLSFIILLSLLSYLFTGKADQSLIDSGLSFSDTRSDKFKRFTQSIIRWNIKESI